MSESLLNRERSLNKPKGDETSRKLKAASPTQLVTHWFKLTSYITEAVSLLVVMHIC